MKRARKVATKLTVLENNDPISAETEAILKRVRQRAFELSHTRPQDAHEQYDWIKAESEIISVPPAELSEKEDSFELRFAVAGVNPDDVQVMVTPDRILIKSELRHSHDADVGTVHMCDFKSTTVFRSINLPKAIDAKSVKVEFSDGMIVVRAMKQSATQTRPPKATPTRKAPAKKPAKTA
jgi:HSP20 family protein